MSYQEPTTRPTIETLFKMMREVRDEMRAGYVRVNERFDRVESRLERLEEQLDRVTSVAHETRADQRELKKELREHFTAVK